MSLYESHLSVWQRRQLGLKQDHIGPGIIKEDHKPVLDVIPETEDPKVLIEKNTRKNKKTQIDE